MNKPKKKQINPQFRKDEKGETLDVIVSVEDYAEIQRRLKKWDQIRKGLRAIKKKQTG